MKRPLSEKGAVRSRETRKDASEVSTSTPTVDQENLHRQATHAEVERILKPRSPLERELVFAWFAKKAPRVLDALAAAGSDAWRTKTTKLRGVFFCACCEQILGTDHCSACGHPLPGVLPDRFDFALLKDDE